MFEQSRTSVLDLGLGGCQCDSLLSTGAADYESNKAQLARRAPAHGCQFLPVKNEYATQFFEHQNAAHIIDLMKECKDIKKIGITEFRCA